MEQAMRTLGGSAFIDQISRDLGATRFNIAQIVEGGFRPHRNGVDITAEDLRDLRRREKEAIAILRDEV
jgi:hypothetical protein